MNTGEFISGMRGPGAKWTATFAAPTGVGFTGTTITLASLVGNSPVSGWVEVSRTNTSVTMEYTPTGSELPTVEYRRTRTGVEEPLEPTKILVLHTLTVDGVQYQYPPTIEVVRPYAAAP